MEYLAKGELNSTLEVYDSSKKILHSRLIKGGFKSDFIEIFNESNTQILEIEIKPITRKYVVQSINSDYIKDDFILLNSKKINLANNIIHLNEKWHQLNKSYISLNIKQIAIIKTKLATISHNHKITFEINDKEIIKYSLILFLIKNTFLDLD